MDGGMHRPRDRLGTQRGGAGRGRRRAEVGKEGQGEAPRRWQFDRASLGAGKSARVVYDVQKTQGEKERAREH